MKTNKQPPVKTPWGKAQSMKVIAPGIIKYTTASHGGYHLSGDRNEQVSKFLKKQTFGQLGEKGWYEEDLDWSIVIATFPQYFNQELLDTAIALLETHHPDAWRRARLENI